MTRIREENGIIHSALFQSTPHCDKPGTHWRHVACYMYRIQATCILLHVACRMYRIHVAGNMYHVSDTCRRYVLQVELYMLPTCSTEPATFYKAYTLRIHVAVSVCSMLHVAKSWTCSTFGNMYPNRSTCRQIQDFVAGYKIHVARYKIHAGYMLPATCIRQHVASVYRA